MGRRKKQKGKGGGRSGGRANRRANRGNRRGGNNNNSRGDDEFGGMFRMRDDDDDGGVLAGMEVVEEGDDEAMDVALALAFAQHDLGGDSSDAFLSFGLTQATPITPTPRKERKRNKKDKYASKSKAFKHAASQAKAGPGGARGGSGRERREKRAPRRSVIRFHGYGRLNTHSPSHFRRDRDCDPDPDPKVDEDCDTDPESDGEEENGGDQVGDEHAVDEHVFEIVEDTNANSVVKEVVVEMGEESESDSGPDPHSGSDVWSSELDLDDDVIADVIANTGMAKMLGIHSCSASTSSSCSAAGSDEEDEKDDDDHESGSGDVDLSVLHSMSMDYAKHGLGFVSTESTPADKKDKAFNAAKRRRRWRYGQFLEPSDYLSLVWLSPGELPPPGIIPTPSAQSSQPVESSAQPMEEEERVERVERRKGRKGRKARNASTMSFKQVFNHVADFADSNDQQTALGKLSQEEHRWVHAVARACNVRITRTGSGKRTLVWLTRTPHTLPLTATQSQSLFATHSGSDRGNGKPREMGGRDNGGGKGKDKWREKRMAKGKRGKRGKGGDDGKGGKGRNKGGKGGKGGKDGVKAPSRTAVRVAERAMARIPESNLGYRLLQGMGWEEGDRLGSSRSHVGLQSPVSVTLHPKRKGLGSPYVA